MAKKAHYTRPESPSAYPLCSAGYGNGKPKRVYATIEIDRVTCKRCLAILAKKGISV